MADENEQEKTEQPTEKRLRESREEGSVAKSMEINSLAIFLTGTTIIYFTKESIGNKISGFASYIFSSLNILKINSDQLGDYTLKAVLFFFSILAPILIGLFIISLAAGYGQVGFKIASKALLPKFSHLNPLNGLKKILISSQSISELIKSLLKLTIIALFAYWVLKDAVLDASALIQLTIQEIVNFMVNSAFKLIWKISLVYAVFAGMDFIYQKFQHHKKQMMSKEELKEEFKQSEGNPQLNN